MISNICKSFDVVDDERTIERMIAGSWKGKAGAYDFFLCIDFLHRLENPAAVLETISATLKGGAAMVAIEYVGPPGYAQSREEQAIAEALCAVLGDQVRGEGVSRLPVILPGGSLLAKGARSPHYVLPAIREYFDITDVRYFAGPLLDMVVDRFLKGDIPEDRSDSPEMKAVKGIMELERTLIKGGVLGNKYAMVIAERRRADAATVH
jgi:hypothetical protein